MKNVFRKIKPWVKKTQKTDFLDTNKSECENTRSGSALGEQRNSSSPPATDRQQSDRASDQPQQQISTDFPMNFETEQMERELQKTNTIVSKFSRISKPGWAGITEALQVIYREWEFVKWVGVVLRNEQEQCATVIAAYGASQRLGSLSGGLEFWKKMSSRSAEDGPPEAVMSWCREHGLKQVLHSPMRDSEGVPIGWLVTASKLDIKIEQYIFADQQHQIAAALRQTFLKPNVVKASNLLVNMYCVPTLNEVVKMVISLLKEHCPLQQFSLGFISQNWKTATLFCCPEKDSGLQFDQIATEVGVIGRCITMKRVVAVEDFGQEVWHELPQDVEVICNMMNLEVRRSRLLLMPFILRGRTLGGLYAMSMNQSEDFDVLKGKLSSILILIAAQFYDIITVKFGSTWRNFTSPKSSGKSSNSSAESRPTAAPSFSVQVDPKFAVKPPLYNLTSINEESQPPPPPSFPQNQMQLQTNMLRPPSQIPAAPIPQSPLSMLANQARIESNDPPQLPTQKLNFLTRAPEVENTKDKENQANTQNVNTPKAQENLGKEVTRGVLVPPFPLQLNQHSELFESLEHVGYSTAASSPHIEVSDIQLTPNSVEQTSDDSETSEFEVSVEFQVNDDLVKHGGTIEADFPLELIKQKILEQSSFFQRGDGGSTLSDAPLSLAPIQTDDNIQIITYNSQEQGICQQQQQQFQKLPSQQQLQYLNWQNNNTNNNNFYQNQDYSSFSASQNQENFRQVGSSRRVEQRGDPEFLGDKEKQSLLSQIFSDHDLKSDKQMIQSGLQQQQQQSGLYTPRKQTDDKEQQQNGGCGSLQLFGQIGFQDVDVFQQFDLGENGVEDSYYPQTFKQNVFTTQFLDRKLEKMYRIWYNQSHWGSDIFFRLFSLTLCTATLSAASVQAEPTIAMANVLATSLLEGGLLILQLYKQPEYLRYRSLILAISRIIRMVGCTMITLQFDPQVLWTPQQIANSAHNINRMFLYGLPLPVLTLTMPDVPYINYLTLVVWMFVLVFYLAPIACVRHFASSNFLVCLVEFVTVQFWLGLVCPLALAYLLDARERKEFFLQKYNIGRSSNGGIWGYMSIFWKNEKQKSI